MQISSLKALRLGRLQENLKKLKDYKIGLMDIGSHLVVEIKAIENRIDQHKKGHEVNNGIQVPVPKLKDLEATKNDLRKFKTARGIIDNNRKRIEISITKHEQQMVLYRTRVSVRNTFIDLRKQAIYVSTTIDDRTMVIPLQRGPVGSTTHSVVLSNGTLGEWSFTRTSAIEGLIDIPIELAKDIVGIPAAAFGQEQSRIDAQKAATDSQTNLLKSQADVINAQNALNKAISGDTGSDTEGSSEGETGETDPPTGN